MLLILIYQISQAYKIIGQLFDNYLQLLLKKTKSFGGKNNNLFYFVDIKILWMGLSPYHSYVKQLITRIDSSWLFQHLTINHKFLQQMTGGET